MLISHAPPGQIMSFSISWKISSSLLCDSWQFLLWRHEEKVESMEDERKRSRGKGRAEKKFWMMV